MRKYRCFGLLTAAILTAMTAVFIPGDVCLGESPARKASKGPPPALKGLGSDGVLHLSPRDHCPVCGMFPLRIPQCAAGLRLKNGRTYYFCSNRCLLSTWRYPHTHLGKGAVIAQLVVRDYFSGQSLDGLEAWWIVGSDVIGPMGPALVTLQSSRDVKAFQRRHGSAHLFKLDQIDAILWQKIMPADP